VWFDGSIASSCSWKFHYYIAAYFRVCFILIWTQWVSTVCPCCGCDLAFLYSNDINAVAVDIIPLHSSHIFAVFLFCQAAHFTAFCEYFSLHAQYCKMTVDTAIGLRAHGDLHVSQRVKLLSPKSIQFFWCDNTDKS